MLISTPIIHVYIFKENQNNYNYPETQNVWAVMQQY